MIVPDRMNVDFVLLMPCESLKNEHAFEMIPEHGKRVCRARGLRGRLILERLHDPLFYSNIIKALKKHGFRKIIVWLLKFNNKECNNYGGYIRNDQGLFR